VHVSSSAILNGVCGAEMGAIDAVISSLSNRRISSVITLCGRTEAIAEFS